MGGDPKYITMTTAPDSLPDAEPRERVYFDATLRPHRSLSPRGFLLVMSAIAGGGFLIGTGFFLMGAWPVAGFCGLEILLVYIGFRLNFRDGRRREHLRLTDAGLEIARVAPDGRTETFHLEPGWLSVSIDDPVQHHSQVRLKSHGRTTVVGSFLAPDERASLARALDVAIAHYRASCAAL